MLQDKKNQTVGAVEGETAENIAHLWVENGEKIYLERIFCKNADEGKPYLLTHFKYHNFYI